jgi:hypothetical protein
MEWNQGMLSPDGVWRWDGRSWVPAAPLAARPYRPLGSRPRLAVVALAVAGLTQLAALGALTGRLDLLNRIAGGLPVGFDEAVHSDDVVRTAAIVELCATLGCAVFFLRWLHRVVSNNLSLGARGLRFGPGVAVGWWFLPFANWVIPFKVLAEAWRAADPTQPHSTPELRRASPLPGMLIAWWSTLVMGSLLASIANFTHPATSGDLDTMHTATLLFMGASLLLSAAAVLAAVVVTRLSARQNAQHAVVSGAASAGQ